MNKWLDFSNNANKLNQTYFKGFVDVNYGNIHLRDGYSLNLHNNNNDDDSFFSMNSNNMRIYENSSNYYEIKNSNLLYLNDLSGNIQNQINSLQNSINNIGYKGDISGNLSVYGDASMSGNLLVSQSIGIGKSNPSAPLDIATSTYFTSDGSLNTYFNFSNGYALSSKNSSYSDNYSIICAGSILTTGNVVATNSTTFSDNRIKENVHEIDSNHSLSILRNIQPKQFSYKDKLLYGSSVNYGFIAQDLEKIIDNTVSKITKFVPNIFELCDLNNGNTIRLSKTSTQCFTFDKSNNTTIKIYDSNNNEYITTITKILNDKEFQISTYFDTSCVFVYGQKVDDFRVLDKDSIFTITTSALKEVDRELQITKNELQITKRSVEELTNLVKSQQIQIDKLLQYIEIEQKTSK